MADRKNSSDKILVEKRDVFKTLAGVAAAIGVGAGILGISCLVTRSMIDLAVNRQAPKSVEEIKRILAGSDAMKDILRRQREAAEKLENTEHQVVHIKSFDGLELIGHLFMCENAQRTVIAFHGWRSSWSADFGLIADFLHNNHCNVLYVEQRGQNGSSGDYMGFGLLERYDCLSWIKCIESMIPQLPIYLTGISMGATTVLMASGMDLPDSVHGIVADCGFTSPYAIWKHVVEDNLHMMYVGVRAKVADDICKKKINMKSDEYSCVTALKNCHTPVMFVHGAADQFVPVTMTYENYLACAAPKRLMIVPGADHGMSYLKEQDRYEAEVKRFWRDYDEKKLAEA